MTLRSAPRSAARARVNPTVFLPFLLALLLALTAARAAPAGPFSDLVMAPGTLSSLAEGEALSYTASRSLPPGDRPDPAAPPPIAEGRLDVVAVTGPGGPQIALRRTEDGAHKPEITFAAEGPNPVLLLFLENLVRVMASETGGSPFYIRNRIREALGTADLPAGQGAQSLILQPFAADPNAERIGAWSQLTLTVTFDPAAPGRLIELKADTAQGTAGYTEILRLIAED